jgi:5'-nucleotidase
VKLWVTGRELKSIFEVLNLAYQLKGASYYPRISGARFSYNELRVPFDRVMEIELGDLTNGYHSIPLGENHAKLYSMAATTYVASFFGLITELSHGLLTVVPKDQEGIPLDDLRDGIIDGDSTRPGIQEIKEWRALLDYAKALPDSDGDGIPNLEVNAVTNEMRMRPVRSFSPSAMSQNATYLMGTTVALCSFIALALIWLTWMGIRRLSAY